VGKWGREGQLKGWKGKIKARISQILLMEVQDSSEAVQSEYFKIEWHIKRIACLIIILIRLIFL
jgi:hypothetical protein